MKQEELPIIKIKKKFNLKEFVKVANKVKKSFLEQQAYLEKERQKNGDNNSSGLFYID